MEIAGPGHWRTHDLLKAGLDRFESLQDVQTFANEALDSTKGYGGSGISAAKVLGPHPKHLA